MKKIIQIIFVAVAMFSCKDVEYTPSGKGDALIIVKVTETDTLFGLGLHAFSYDNFSNVYVNHIDNSDIKFNLKTVDGYMNDLYYESSDAAFSKELPPIGEYVFLAGFPDGESISFSDELLDDFILPPNVTTFQFNTSRDRIDISWEKNTEVDVYNIKLYDLDSDLLFYSSSLNSESSSYSIGISSDTWLEGNAPAPGTDYVVEISAYMNEPDGGNLDLQSVGRIKKVITWQ